MPDITPEALAFLQAVQKEAEAAAKKGGSAESVRNKYRTIGSEMKYGAKEGKVDPRAKRRKATSPVGTSPAEMERRSSGGKPGKRKSAPVAHDSRPANNSGQVMDVREATLKKAAIDSLKEKGLIKTKKTFGNAGRDVTQKENLERYGNIKGAQPGDPTGEKGRAARESRLAKLKGG